VEDSSCALEPIAFEDAPVGMPVDLSELDNMDDLICAVELIAFEDAPLEALIDPGELANVEG
jgi:hypothetical protein